MNPLLANDLATCHQRDLRHLGDQRRRSQLLPDSGEVGVTGQDQELLEGAAAYLFVVVGQDLGRCAGVGQRDALHHRVGHGGQIGAPLQDCRGGDHFEARTWWNATGTLVVAVLAAFPSVSTEATAMLVYSYYSDQIIVTNGGAARSIFRRKSDLPSRPAGARPMRATKSPFS